MGHRTRVVARENQRAEVGRGGMIEIEVGLTIHDSYIMEEKI